MLLALGLLKWISMVMTGPERLAVVDPVLQAPTGWVYALGGALEVVAGTGLLAGRRFSWRAWLVFLLGCGYSGYHAVAGMRGVATSCPCLGALPRWLPVSWEVQESLARGLALWLMIVGGWSVRWNPGGRGLFGGGVSER